MRFFLKTKRFFVLFCAASILMLCSCSRLGSPIMYNDDGKKADARLEQVIQAIKNKDKDTLKSMFSEQAQSEAEDLDGRIDYVLGFIQGDIVSWESIVSGAGAESVDQDGQRVKKVLSWYSVKTDKEEYLFYLVEFTVDTENPENVGLYMLKVINMKDKETQFGEVNRNIHAGIYKPDSENTDDGNVSPT